MGTGTSESMTLEQTKAACPFAPQLIDMTIGMGELKASITALTEQHESLAKNVHGISEVMGRVDDLLFRKNGGRKSLAVRFVLYEMYQKWIIYALKAAGIVILTLLTYKFAPELWEVLKKLM